MRNIAAALVSTKTFQSSFEMSYILQLLSSYEKVHICQKLWKLDVNRQSSCNNKQAYFLAHPVYRVYIS